jgi:hypothetical protein
MSTLDELKDLLKGPLDLVPLVNGAVYSFGFSIFGAPAWKCIVVGIIAFAASKLHYGRRVISRLGVLVLIASMFIWADVIPHPGELLQRARAVMAEFHPWRDC